MWPQTGGKGTETIVLTAGEKSRWLTSPDHLFTLRAGQALGKRGSWLPGVLPESWEQEKQTQLQGEKLSFH